MIKAVTAGYAGGSEIWYMTADGIVESATIGVDLANPYFYSDTQLRGFGVVSSAQEQIRILKSNTIKECKMWKTEVSSPGLTKKFRTHAKETAEDDIVYLERRLGADGEIEWVPPKRISYMDIESDRDTAQLELIGSVLDGKYESFKTADEYFTYLETEKVAAVTAWNGNHYDFRILGEVGNEYWGHVQKIDSMDLYAKFSARKTRRGLDVVARREKVGEKLNPETTDPLVYNENDCRIMEGVIKKLDLIGTEYELSRLTGILPSPDNLRAIALFENYLMKNRKKYKLWLEGGRGFQKATDKIKGAIVLYGNPGLYDGVEMFDFTSLYPSVVMYEDYKGNGEEVWKINKALAFDWVALKEECGRKGLKTQREAYKVLANGSGYGIFASSSFRYSNKMIASFITARARAKLMEMRKVVEDMGFNPLLSDTDSAAVLVPKDKALPLLRVINKKVAPFVVKPEYYLSRLILFGGGDDGAAIKKRYAGLTESGELVVKGLEMVRNDWSPYARDLQERLLRIMLTCPKEEVKVKMSAAIKAEKELFLSGKLPVEDVAITKSIDTEKEYKVKTQHVKAYEKMTDKQQGVIGFVTYWLDGKGETFVRNGMTDEEVAKKLDWRFLWKHQAEAMIERLKSSYAAPVKTLELFLEKEP